MGRIRSARPAANAALQTPLQRRYVGANGAPEARKGIEMPDKLFPTNRRPCVRPRSLTRSQIRPSLPGRPVGIRACGPKGPARVGGVRKRRSTRPERAGSDATVSFPRMPRKKSATPWTTTGADGWWGTILVGKASNCAKGAAAKQGCLRTRAKPRDKNSGHLFGGGRVGEQRNNGLRKVSFGLSSSLHDLPSLQSCGCPRVCHLG